MQKVLFAVISASVTAFSALAPAEAGPTRVVINRSHAVIPIHDDWRAESVAPPCWVKRSWRHDYAGNLYLKKVRVCA